jgi:uridine phosphorylase
VTTQADRDWLPPILAGKDYAAASVFTPANLLREARRQKGLPAVPVPEICVLDPDGDILRSLRRSGHASRLDHWACYHTELYAFDHEGEKFGIIGCAVGAAFAVLLAEELFACGCRFLVSVTSAGQILAEGETPYFVLIDRALRDEGTSYHYLPPAEFVDAEPTLAAAAFDQLRGTGQRIYRGAAWTTDAPFRETEAAIRQARARGILAVEMEAAALYAFAMAQRRAVLCFAHVTNRMAVTSGDFEKGQDAGSAAALAVIAAAARGWRASGKRDRGEPSDG